MGACRPRRSRIRCATTTAGAPLDGTVDLTARVAGREGRSTALDCVLLAGGKECAKATVRAVRVPDAWRHPANAPTGQ